MNVRKLSYDLQEGKKSSNTKKYEMVKSGRLP